MPLGTALVPESSPTLACVRIGALPCYQRDGGIRIRVWLGLGRVKAFEYLDGVLSTAVDTSIGALQARSLPDLGLYLPPGALVAGLPDAGTGVTLVHARSARPRALVRG